MTCDFKRCEDETAHCDGACHGMNQDGSKPLMEIPAVRGNGWLEAAVAWEVCASIHRLWAKGKDVLFSTRQADFVNHAADARKKHLDWEAASNVSSSPDFIRRTNVDYARWCATHYVPESLDEFGRKSLDGLWAWQEQERRKEAPAESAPVPSLWSEAEAVALAHRSGFAGTCWTMGPEELAHTLNLLCVPPASKEQPSAESVADELVKRLQFLCIVTDETKLKQIRTLVTAIVSGV